MIRILMLASFAVENIQLNLNLQTENKGSLVSGGELSVCLDGLAVDLGSLPNGSAVTDSYHPQEKYLLLRADSPSWLDRRAPGTLYK
ncbi:UNVERIFIED_CONTAM: hypothetical protein FKN15_070226 [Acipenser sinensis]